jgi:hypothetical protein
MIKLRREQAFNDKIKEEQEKNPNKVVDESKWEHIRHWEPAFIIELDQVTKDMESYKTLAAK